MKTGFAGLLLLACALGAGCIMPDDFDRLNTDVNQIRAQIDTLRAENQKTAEAVRRIEEAASAGDDGERERAAEARRQIEGIREEVRVVSTRLDEMDQRLVRVSRQVSSAPARTEPVAPAPADGTAPPGTQPPRAATAEAPDTIFNAAYADYSKGNYTPAILGFEDYLRQYPDSDRADDALYWIGLCHYDQGQYSEAITSFDRLIQQHPDGDKLPGAHLKKGLSLIEMNRTAQGVVQLQYVAEKFPRSQEARVARERLKELGVKP